MFYNLHYSILNRPISGCSVLFSKNYTSLTNYDALEYMEHNDDKDVVHNLDASLEKEDESTLNEIDELLQFSDTTHSYLSPVTKKLHQEIHDTSECYLNIYDEESVVYSKKNMIQAITYMLDHGDPIKNNTCATMIRELEKTITEAKLRIQSDVYTTPTKTGVCFPAFTNQKPKIIPKRLKGRAE